MKNLFFFLLIFLSGQSFGQLPELQVTRCAKPGEIVDGVRYDSTVKSFVLHDTTWVLHTSESDLTCYVAVDPPVFFFEVSGSGKLVDTSLLIDKPSRGGGVDDLLSLTHVTGLENYRTYSYFHEYAVDYKDPSGISKTSESAHFMQTLRGEKVESDVKYVPGQFLWYKYSRSGIGAEKVRVVDNSAADEKVRVFPVLMIGSDVYYLCVTLDGYYFYFNEKELKDDISKHGKN